MAREDKALARMRANPQGDWRIEDVLRVAERVGLDVRKPSSGSHYIVQSRALERQVVVPYHRPIKPVYVGRFVVLVDEHFAASSGGSPGGPDA